MNSERKLTVGYWDAQKRYFSSAKGRLEFLLKSFGDVTFYPVSSLEDPKLKTCDTLLTTADHVAEEDFLPWFTNFEGRVYLNQLIWVPAIILTSISLNKQRELLRHSLQSNWYFDVVDPAHLDSLPLRMANMIRIHDHLRELNRYDQELTQLQTRTKDLEEQILLLRS